ncbi:ras-related protein Rap-2a isoform X1 [Vespa crabro]|uniref:ras-related protein Rap-2a isoform X1 n=2 Tax=Vespa crabro TaxID=7445 RepID=UPI001EFF91D1|nr:ras-related protein Rap-2a isoform X1 [Vespa crabro]
MHTYYRRSDKTKKRGKFLAQMMKGRHHFRRRFSLQPSSLKEGQEDGTTKNIRNERLSESDSGGGGEGGKSVESSVRHKIVVMGAAKVGKSAIINQFLYGTFTPKYKRTVEEMHHGDFNVSGIHLTLDILDTSGSYEFPAMRDLSIKSADAFVLVYDVNDVNTFHEVKTLRALILNTKGVVPIVVVGNKLDLVEKEQEVDSESTRVLVTAKWENGFVQVSAKDNLNISQVFKELLLQAKLKYNLSPALRRRRRQSLPPPPHLNSRSSSAHVPSPAQLQHLQQIRERAESKRNSCILS